MLVSRAPEISDEKLATIVADSLEKFINDNNLATGNFAWQQTASAFSVSKSDVDKICKYMLNQPEHHKKLSFEDEYQSFLKYYQKTIQKHKTSFGDSEQSMIT